VSLPYFKTIFTVRSAFLALLLALTPYSAKAVQCDFRDHLNHLFSKKKSFNKTHYENKVSEFQKAIAEQTRIKYEGLSPEDRIALLEAMTKNAHTNPLNLGEILEKNPVFRKKVMRITKQLKMKNGFRLSNLNQVFDEMFASIHPKFDALRSRQWKGQRDKLINQWIDQELGRKNMESAAKSLGILKDETAMERFRIWKKRHQNALNLSMNLSANGPMLYFFKTPGNLPKVSFFKSNAKLFEKIEREGLESVKPEIFTHYKNKATAQVIYDNVVRNYTRVFKGVMAYYIYQNWDETKTQVKLMYSLGKNSIESFFLDENELQQQINRTFSLEAAQEEEIMNTIQTISEEQNGKIAPVDVWNQVKAHLELTTEDLKPNVTGNEEPGSDSDRKNRVTNEQIQQVSLKLLNEMVEQKTIQPSVLKKFESWTEKKRN
jgi:hypothetical protein